MFSTICHSPNEIYFEHNTSFYFRSFPLYYFIHPSTEYTETSPTTHYSILSCCTAVYLSTTYSRTIKNIWNWLPFPFSFVKRVKESFSLSFLHHFPQSRVGESQGEKWGFLNQTINCKVNSNTIIVSIHVTYTVLYIAYRCVVE